MHFELFELFQDCASTELVPPKLLSAARIRSAATRKIASRPGKWNAELVVPSICRVWDSELHFVKVCGMILAANVSVFGSVRFTLRFARRECANNMTSAQEDFDEHDFVLAIRVMPFDSDEKIFERVVNLGVCRELESFMVATGQRYIIKRIEDMKSEHRRGGLTVLYSVSCGPKQKENVVVVAALVSEPQ